MTTTQRLSALWKRTSKNGAEYMTCSLGDARLMIFPNRHKNGEKDPDFKVWVVASAQGEELTQPVQITVEPLPPKGQQQQGSYNRPAPQRPVDDRAQFFGGPAQAQPQRPRQAALPVEPPRSTRAPMHSDDDLF